MTDSTDKRNTFTLNGNKIFAQKIMYLIISYIKSFC